MPMESEMIAQEHKRKEMSAHGFSLVSGTCGVMMIIVGSIYWPEESCRTGATTYLYYGGVFSLTVNLLSLVTSVAKWWALKDGKISMTEERVLWLLGLSSSVIVLCDLIVVIWGSVVVFYNYSSWTYTEPTSEDFCEKTPMVFAFTLLLIKWLMIPAIVIVGCITAVCCPKEASQVNNSPS